ncbi:hypothetical protein Bealeia2_01910 (plasmid) [Candidatus Bealeia paramacronuclearis]|uniref:terminase large subunit domain-containing protein n=1 Tax=Candidatus Bealeia paramacronuclearis TaxID=1921001 RepID=UPI002CF4F01D|nr:hypothetical protein [Candidatus Bealeia paramacronuclearis]
MHPPHLNDELARLFQADPDHFRALIAQEYQRQFLGYRPHPVQKTFHSAGKTARERLFLAGNRVGKTYACAVETSMHLTGHYPEWWEGYRFAEPIQAWVVGPSREITRDSLQKQYYLGDTLRKITGLIDHSLIIKKTVLSGIPEAISTALVRHRSGGISNLVFKSYDQALDKFSGTFVNVIHLDEEPGDYRILEECAMRIMSTRASQYGLITAL